jgi:hypothetical protein
MKRLLPLLLLAAMIIAGCKKDDSTTAPITQTNDPIVGTWLETGANVAPGFKTATFKYVSVTAIFKADSSVTTSSIDSLGSVSNYTGGVYHISPATADTAIRSIVITYSNPAVTQTGIFQIKGTTMRFEAIQTTPQLTGVTAPTVTGGFGSTKYNGYALGATWIQTFVKQ